MPKIERLNIMFTNYFYYQKTLFIILLFIIAILYSCGNDKDFNQNLIIEKEKAEQEAIKAKEEASIAKEEASKANQEIIKYKYGYTGIGISLVVLALIIGVVIGLHTRREYNKINNKEATNNEQK